MRWWTFLVLYMYKYFRPIKDLDVCALIFEIFVANPESFLSHQSSISPIFVKIIIAHAAKYFKKMFTQDPFQIFIYFMNKFILHYCEIIIVRGGRMLVALVSNPCP